MLQLADSKKIDTYKQKKNMANKTTRTIAVTSGKGGVGKTHTTVNLGLALAALGNKVLLLDGDLGLANINILLGFKPKKTLQEVVKGEADLSEVIVEALENLHVIPASSGIPELTLLSEHERLSLINAFDDLANEYDYLLIDTAAGIGDNVLYFNVAAEDILVVISPEPTSITDAYALIKVLSTHCNRKEFNILVNRASNMTEAKSTYLQLANATEHFLNVSLKLIGHISEDSSVSQAVIQQTPFIKLYPSCKASLDISKVANKINAQQRKVSTNGGLQFFFKSLLEN